jgi:hypothetical protein
MSTSKFQRARVEVICACGCGERFYAFPVYQRGGGLRVPEFQRGHHPNCRKVQFGESPWNRGLTKQTTPAVGRQGRRGLGHWNFDPEQSPDWFAVDFDFAAFAAKFGTKQRSKGGNKAYAKFRLAILKRDNFTCADCGFSEHIGKDSPLHVHHVVEVKRDKTRIFDPSNVVTLCFNCHWKRHHKQVIKRPI